MKLLHLITRLDIGGSSENTIISVTRLPRKEFACSLISGRTVNPAPGLRETIVHAGVQWIEIPQLRREVGVHRDALALGRLWRLIRQARPDIVHTHSSKGGFLGRLAARLAGVPRIVHTPHGHVFHGYFRPDVARGFITLERLAARWTDRIITLTDAEARQHLAVGIGRPEQFLTIPSGVDFSDLAGAPRRAAGLRASLNLPPEARLVGAVSRLAPVKGLQHLIAAMPEILRGCPNAYLVIAGDGEQRTALERQAVELELSPHVKFLGYQTDPAAVTAMLDIFVLPSINEGLGRALVRAMALGKPIVASQVGGVPELLADGLAGWLVSPADPQSLAGAIGTLLTERGRATALGEAGRVRAPRYSVEAMLDALMKLYRELGKR